MTKVIARRNLMTSIVLSVAFVVGPAAASAEQTAALELTANGGDIEGESTIPGLENTIELYKVAHEMMIVGYAPGVPPGPLTAEPLVLRTKVDKATPLLIKALTNNEQIEARIRFFRPASDGSGLTEHYFTIEVSQALITRFRSVHSTSTEGPAIFEFELSYEQIAWTYESTGAAHAWQFRDPS